MNKKDDLNTDYDIRKAFSRIEDDLINRMIDSIKSGEFDVKDPSFKNWYYGQLQGLNKFKTDNKKYYDKDSQNLLKAKIKDAILNNYKEGSKKEKDLIERQIEKGFKTPKNPTNDEINAAMNGINDRKLKSLIQQTQDNLLNAQVSAVRYAEDNYRKIIFDANVYFNTSSGTLQEAIDMATKDFLSQGINNIEYKDGRRVNIQSYAEMALRTSNKRAYMQGEASMRDTWGIKTVIVTRRGNACPRCMNYVGKVFVDDVYSSIPMGKISEYPPLSMAVAGGLFHPNCRDTITTYFPGITTKRKEPTKEDKEEAQRIYNLEQQQRAKERKVRKFDILAKGSTDEANKEKYQNLKKAATDDLRKFVNDNSDVLNRRLYREVNYGIKDQDIIRENNANLNNDNSINKTPTTNEKTFKDKLSEALNFGYISKEVNYIDDDIKEAVFGQMRALNEKYKIIDENTTLKCCKDDKSIGSVTAPYTNPIKQILNLSSSFYKDAETLKKTIKHDSEANWIMKIKEEDYLKYNITHEYGHMIENKLINEEMNKLGKNNLEEMMDKNETNSRKRLKPFIDFYNKTANDYRKEILNIAKSKNKNFNIDDNMSDYGKSNSFEFFAECFANMELGTNNELGQALQEFLKKKGML